MLGPTRAPKHLSLTKTSSGRQTCIYSQAERNRRATSRMGLAPGAAHRHYPIFSRDMHIDIRTTDPEINFAALDHVPQVSGSLTLPMVAVHERSVVAVISDSDRGSPLRRRNSSKRATRMQAGRELHPARPMISD